MKKSPVKLIVGTTIAATAINATSCFVAPQNVPEAVYGPPEYFESTFDPSNNVPEDVYGPPEWFEGTEEEAGQQQTLSETSGAEATGPGTGSVEDVDIEDETETAYDPEENIPVAVYGPPEWFSNQQVRPAEEFEPSDNIPEDVYGPPSYFGMPDDEPDEG